MKRTAIPFLLALLLTACGATTPEGTSDVTIRIIACYECPEDGTDLMVRMSGETRYEETFTVADQEEVTMRGIAHGTYKVEFWALDRGCSFRGESREIEVPDTRPQQIGIDCRPL
jgi:hypothetical protein